MTLLGCHIAYFLPLDISHCEVDQISPYGHFRLDPAVSVFHVGLWLHRLAIHASVLMRMCTGHFPLWAISVFEIQAHKMLFMVVDMVRQVFRCANMIDELSHYGTHRHTYRHMSFILDMEIHKLQASSSQKTLHLLINKYELLSIYRQANGRYASLKRHTS